MRGEQVFKFPDEVILPNKPIPDLKVKDFGWLAVAVALYAACFVLVYYQGEEFPILLSFPFLITIIVSVFFIKGTSPHILIAILGGTALLHLLVLTVVYLIVFNSVLHDDHVGISLQMFFGLVYASLILLPFTFLLFLRFFKIIGSSPVFLFSSVAFINMLSSVVVFVLLALEKAHIG